jgi:hypothetical protein
VKRESSQEREVRERRALRYWRERARSTGEKEPEVLERKSPKYWRERARSTGGKEPEVLVLKCDEVRMVEALEYKSFT